MIMAGSTPKDPLIIEPDEMGFAIALFVAAARGQVLPPRHQSSGFTLSHDSDGLDPLLAGARISLGEGQNGASDEVPLACAVSVLWHHYEHNPLQQSICSRLVAFYSLMVRSKGMLLEPWMTNDAADSELMALSPAIVEAVANAPMNEDGQFIDSAFRDRVQSLSEQDARSNGPSISEVWKTRIEQRPGAEIPITEVVGQLSHHLYAFQSCVASLHDPADAPQFRVIEQLCGKIAEVHGNTSLEALLSRALVATRADFPWLRSAKASKSGELVGLEQIYPPDPEQAMRGELAVLSSLIELLRSFLGDSVTLQLLRTLWPLASLNHETESKV